MEEKEIISKARKLGASTYILIPKDDAELLSLQDGEPVAVKIARIRKVFRNGDADE